MQRYRILATGNTSAALSVLIVGNTSAGGCTSSVLCTTGCWNIVPIFINVRAKDGLRTALVCTDSPFVWTEDFMSVTKFEWTRVCFISVVSAGWNSLFRVRSRVCLVSIASAG